ncbi:uncharacterized protein LOC105179434 [Sesamum indicum]|uniref:Uncharacterized protein LOC105179434 n=1 Tax=Sesamum indicum TaxID=4182 RepID=A0A6I9V157_SESIN|nr:uncharacterized protein LOC105179434 [Sesamum indicum]
MTLGHTTKECAHNKTAKSIKTPVAVYVPKVKAPRAQVVSESNKEAMPNRGKEVLAVQRREKQTVIRDTPSLEVGPSREEGCSNDPWLVGGDFNVIRDLNEEAGLFPLPMQGEWYTWHNYSTTTRSLWKRLDRILINDLWFKRFPTSSYHSLLPRTSDHSPLVLHGDSPQHNGGMFRFDNYLANSPDFIPSVQNIWQHEVIGVPMYAVTHKLKALKQVFRQQRRNKGDLTRNVRLAKGFLNEAQTLVSSDRQNELFLYLEHCCRMVYAKAAKTEQIMLQQRAKMQWMTDGDQCSRVFFRKIAQRRATRRILQINEFVHYYQNLLGGNRRRILVDINYLRPWARHILSDEEASHLLSPFSLEEVKLAVFDIAGDKASGPDGYSSGF